MRSSAIALLFPFALLAGCGENEPPTAPAAASTAAAVSNAAAAHRVVNSLADPGDGVCDARQCTLREAIEDPGSTEVSFAPGLTVITLASPENGGGPLVINKSLSIRGPSARIVIRRRSTDPAFRIFQIFSFVSVPTVTLTNLIVKGGESNIEPLGGLGGGIFNSETLRLINCVVTDNSGDGGGIFNIEGTLTLVNSRVSSNAGGGITNNGRTAVLTLIHSTVFGNSSLQGAGVLNQGTMTVTSSTISGNTGSFAAGILNQSGGTTLTNSTVSNNSAVGQGGGIANMEGRLNLTNSTVSGNSAAGEGGGILIIGTTSRTRLRNTTVAHNSAGQGGGGIRTSGPLILSNALVAVNTAPLGPDVLKSGGLTAPVTARFSLLGIGSGSSVSDGVNGNQVGNRSKPLDPLLDALANNGGPTRTHALLAGSPAIDAASTQDCPATDQRGVSRPQGAGCDVGSYERK